MQDTYPAHTSITHLKNQKELAYDVITRGKREKKTADLEVSMRVSSRSLIEAMFEGNSQLRPFSFKGADKASLVAT